MNNTGNVRGTEVELRTVVVHERGVAAALFEGLWKTLEISNDEFILTNEPRQVKAVQYLLEPL